MLEQIIGYVVEYGPKVLIVLGALGAALAVIAPLTNTKLDDKLLGVFSKISAVLAWLVAKLNTRAAVNQVFDAKADGTVGRLSKQLRGK